MKENTGALVETGLPKLLHLIYREADPAAILDIVREPVKKRFFFKDGVPVYATSNVLGEVLGRLLMAEGIITQKEYEGSLETVLKEKRRHGEVLTSMGLITTGELDNFLTLQLKRRLWRIFGWDQGAFDYKRIEKPPEGITPMPLHPARLILDGISLGFYPLSRIKQDLSKHIDDVVSVLRYHGLESDHFGTGRVAEEEKGGSIVGRGVPQFAQNWCFRSSCAPQLEHFICTSLE